MPSLRAGSITATVSCLGLIHISSTGFSPCWTRSLGWSWTSPRSATYQLPSATISTVFQSEEGSTSRSLYGPTLLGWCCAGIPDGTVPSCWLSRRSTMSPVGFLWWPRCSEVSASDIRPSGLRCLKPLNLELSSAQDQTIARQFIAFQTETESAFISAVLSASVDCGSISDEGLYKFPILYSITIISSWWAHVGISSPWGLYGP